MVILIITGYAILLWLIPFAKGGNIEAVAFAHLVTAVPVGFALAFIWLLDRW